MIPIILALAASLATAPHAFITAAAASSAYLARIQCAMESKKGLPVVLDSRVAGYRRCPATTRTTAIPTVTIAVAATAAITTSTTRSIQHA
jgi:hypothetical protein